MLRPSSFLFALTAAALASSACGGSNEPRSNFIRNPPGDAGTTAVGDAAVHDTNVEPRENPRAVSLTVEPANGALDVTEGTTARLALHVRARMADGTVMDPAPAVMTIDHVGLGTFEGTTFVASGRAGGVANVTASYLGARLTVPLTVRLIATRRADDVAADLATRAAEAVASAADDGALRPEVLYPATGTEIPPNLYRLEWQWRAPTGADLYVLTFRSPALYMRYVTRADRLELPTDAWRLFANTNRGGEVEATVHAMRSSDMTRAGRAAVRVRLGRQDLAGAVYYFTTNDEATRQGIFRYDFGTPVPAATRFLSQETAGGCVGCHALSRDGARMAVTFEGGWGNMATLEVREPSRYMAGGPRGPSRGSFAAFLDGDASVLAVYDNGVDAPSDPLNGQVLVYDARTGMEDVARRMPLPRGHRAAHVNVSSDGRAVAFTEYDDDARPIRETRGSICVIDYDPERRAWGELRRIVPFDGVTNNYYPSISPDGRWVLFNRARGSSYDNPEASLWVVPIDGSRPPVQLAAADRGAMLTNSWPRWAPFIQRDEVGATRLWFTFSSKRDYGSRLVNLRRPQIWMAAFDPVAAAQGRDGSRPAFWLPVQDPATQNHTASWTERAVPRNCQSDGDCGDPGLRCDAGTLTCVPMQTPP